MDKKREKMIAYAVGHLPIIKEFAMKLGKAFGFAVALKHGFAAWTIITESTKIDDKAYITKKKQMLPSSMAWMTYPLAVERSPGARAKANAQTGVFWRESLLTRCSASFFVQALFMSERRALLTDSESGK